MSVQADNSGDSLDLFSISQKSEPESVTYAAVNPSVSCINNAPFFAWKSSEYGWQIVQGCCNDWNCPKCGIKRAKAEYGRIVEGCRELAKEHDLYFITLTCRGKEMSLAEAEAGYLKWTNKLLSAMRYHARKNDEAWHYAAVTERQQRGHPHSHLIGTWKPHDLRDGFKDDWKTINGKRVNVPKPALRSDWLEARCISAGLGNQYDISLVKDAEAVSRYVAKYLFKPEQLETVWPKNWRRIRYSQSFPKLPERKSEAIVLITDEHWLRLAEQAAVVTPLDQASFEACEFMQHCRHDILIRPFKLGENNRAESE